jgi:sterol desaturase/sphingolipid hydroxylase (fatty acid hydroxylase superfamily)
MSPSGAVAITTFSALLGLFYHANISTPHWLGYLVQRPEAHRVHHQRDVHAFNYCELPVFDILFGTFNNPRQFHGQCGFDGDREQRFGDMLAGRDVER